MKKHMIKIFLILLAVGFGIIGSIRIKQVHTAEQQNGWDQEKSHYYVNGKMVKNKFYTIGSSKYYFNSKGKVKTGIAVINGKFYRFTSTGRLNLKATKKIRSAAKYEKDFATLRKLLGKPKKSIYQTGCYGPGKDGILTYSGFTVYTYKENGKEIYMGVE